MSTERPMTFRVVRHKDTRTLMRAWVRGMGLSAKESKGFEYGCIDDKGRMVILPPAEQEKAIRKQGTWGFVFQGKGRRTIHFWCRPRTSKQRLIQFFGHELGHMVEPNLKRLHADESRADRYSGVAVLAYKLAMDVKQ